MAHCVHPDRRLFLATAGVALVASGAVSTWAAGAVLPSPQALVEELERALTKANE